MSYQTTNKEFLAPHIFRLGWSSKSQTWIRGKLQLQDKAYPATRHFVSWGKQGPKKEGFYPILSV